MNRPPDSAPWRPAPLRIAALCVGGFVAISQWVRILYGPGGDFNLHYEFGQRFFAGEYLYVRETHVPYPPFWGLVNVPMTAVPMPWAHALLYPASLVALATLTWLLARATRRALPLPYARLFWATTLAMLLASRFLIREIPECGPNLIMVALAWVGFDRWRARREWSGGCALGLAIALKCTPALFVAYYAWKRQWKMAIASTLFAVGFTLAPLAWLGPASYTHHMKVWVGNVARGLGEADPTLGVLGQEEVKNVSLRPVLGRALVRLPEGHLSRLESTWQLRGLGLPPRAAGLVVKALMVALLAGVAWRSRRPVADRGDLALAWEAATVSLLLLLYSPITWKQHCVGAYPAFYLIARTAVARRGLPGWMVAALAGFAVAVVGLDRGVVGKEWTLVLDSYGVTTWSLLLVLSVTLALARRARLDDSGACAGMADRVASTHRSEFDVASESISMLRSGPRKFRGDRSPYPAPTFPSEAAGRTPRSG